MDLREMAIPFNLYVIILYSDEKTKRVIHVQADLQNEEDGFARLLMARNYSRIQKPSSQPAE